MPSIKRWDSSSDAVDYYQHEQPQYEYYTNGSKDCGTILGAEVFGIVSGSMASKEVIHNLLDGKSPEGKPLVQSAGKGHRPGYDLTFSPPKSVSILWAFGDKETSSKVLNAHNNAVLEALKYLEKFAGKARRGHAGKRVEPVKNLIFAQFQHSTSRENDPQIHTHNLLFNLAERIDGTFGAIEASYIYDEIMASDAIYKSYLAKFLERDLGVNTLPKGKAFEISGIDQKLIEEFSTRREQIKKDLAKKGLSSAKSSDISALETRKKKEKIEYSELQKQWKKRAEIYPSLDFNRIFAHQKTSKKQPNFSKIISEITDHESTFTTTDLRKFLAQYLLETKDPEKFETYYQELLKHPELIKLREEKSGELRFSTKEIVKIEQNILDYAKKKTKSRRFVTGKKVIKHEIKKYEETASEELQSQLKTAGKSNWQTKKIELTDEQKAMIFELTESKGKVKIAQGIAGAGKSYALTVAKNIWEKEKFEIIGLGPTARAARGLEASSGIKSCTLDRFFLTHKTNLNPLKKIVYVVDEAAMVGSKKMAKLFDFAEKDGAKIVLTGDTRQLQPVQAGNPTKLLEKHIGSVKLNAVYRQKEEWQREATKLLATGKAKKALKKYHEKGQFEIFSSPDFAKKKLVSDYIKHHNNSKKSQKKIVIATKNQHVRLLNSAIREKLIEDKKLENGHEFVTTNRFEEKVIRNFSQGDRIVFTKNNRRMGVDNGHFGEIIFADKSGNILVKLDGEVEQKTVKFNVKDYSNIDHGYAATTHQLQGSTYDYSFVYFSEVTSLEMVYVQLSRHKIKAKSYLDSSNFSDFSGWNEIKKEQNKEKKIEKISQKSFTKFTEKASKSKQKNSSLDYVSQSKIPQKSHEVEFEI